MLHADTDERCRCRGRRISAPVSRPARRWDGLRLRSLKPRSQGFQALGVTRPRARRASSPRTSGSRRAASLRGARAEPYHPAPTSSPTRCRRPRAGLPAAPKRSVVTISKNVRVVAQAEEFDTYPHAVAALSCEGEASSGADSEMRFDGLARGWSFDPRTRSYVR